MTQNNYYSNHKIKNNSEVNPIFHNQFLMQAEIAIAISDVLGRLLYVNPAFEQLLGWSFKELTGGILPTVPSHLLQEHELIQGKVADGEKVSSFETVRIHKNGGLLDVSLTLWPIKNEDGSIVAISTALINISEKMELKKQLETLNEVLRASNKRHFELLESISDGFCAINYKWNFTFLNMSLEKIFKKTRQELLGESIWSVLPIDSHPGIYHNLFHAMKGSKVVRFQEYSPKFNKYLQFSTYPSKEGLSIFTQDVSEQVRMIEALIESEERFHLLANNMSEIFWIASPDLQEWYYVSPAVKNILGYTKEEIEEHIEEVLERINSHDFQRVRKACKQMKERETIFEFRYQQPNKSVQWIRIKGLPVFKDGTLEVLVGIAEDITQIIEREELLTKSEKLSTVGQLAAGIAHEIRNPLTSIKGFLQIIKSEGIVSSSYTKIMLDELERIESIVNEFLYLAKPQEEIKYTVQALKPIINQVIGLMKAEANLKAIQINVDIEALQSAHIMGNANHLKQVFINLIKNSIEAVHANGIILIEGNIDYSQSVINMKIVDNGPGISKGRLKKLGEPFYSTKEKGTGLGLMITRKLIEDHLGELNFESEVGNGTVVHIQLPLIVDEETQQ